MPACGQAVGWGVYDTPELWCGAAGLCARVRACAGAAESLHTYIQAYTVACRRSCCVDNVCPLSSQPSTVTVVVEQWHTHTTVAGVRRGCGCVGGCSSLLGVELEVKSTGRTAGHSLNRRFF